MKTWKTFITEDWPYLVKRIDKLFDNDLPHLYNRVSRLEGEIALVIALVIAILVIVLTKL